MIKFHKDIKDIKLYVCKICLICFKVDPTTFRCIMLLYYFCMQKHKFNSFEAGEYYSHFLKNQKGRKHDLLEKK